MGDDDPRGEDALSDEPTQSLAPTSGPPATGEPGAEQDAEPGGEIEVTFGETVGRYQVRRLLGR